MYLFIVRNQFLFNFILLSALSGLSVGIGKFITSVLALDIGANAFELGLIASAQSLGIILTSLPVGSWVDRFGPQRLFIIGSLSIGVFYSITGWLHEPWLLAVITFLVSLCLPFRFVSLNAVFFQKLDVIGVTKAGWFRAMHMIGFFMLAPVVSALLLKAFSVIDVFLLVGLLFLVTALLSPSVMRFYSMPDLACQPAGKGPSLSAQLRLLRSEFDLFFVCVVEFIAQAIMGFFSFYIVVIAIVDFGFSPSIAALLVMLEGGVFVSVLFLGGYVTRQLKTVTAYRLGVVMIMASLALLAVKGAAIGLWVGSALLGLSLGFLHVVNISEFALIGKRLGQGKIAGINGFVGPLGGLIGSLWGGVVGAVISLQWCFLGFLVLIVPLFKLIEKRYKPEEHLEFRRYEVSRRVEIQLERLSTLLLGLLRAAVKPLKSLAVPAALFLLWSATSHYQWVPEQLLPPPSLVYASFIEFWSSGELFFHTQISLERLFASLLIGVPIGVLLGVAFGLSRNLHLALFPLFNLLAQFPIIGWVPILVILLGIDEELKVAAITLAVIPPIVINVYQGIKHIPRQLVEAARTFKFSILHLFRYLIVPSLVPYFFQGLRQALMQAWLTLVFVELLSSSEGLGYLMVWGRQLMQLDLIILAMLVIGLLGFLLDLVAGLLERQSQKWRWSGRGASKSKRANLRASKIKPIAAVTGVVNL